MAATRCMEEKVINDLTIYDNRSLNVKNNNTIKKVTTLNRELKGGTNG